MRFVDSHLHLGKGEADEVAVLGAATRTLLVVCGTDQETSLEALEFARNHPELAKAFVGVHPSEVMKSGGLGWLEAALEASAGLGEVGLDPAYSPVDRQSSQMEALLGQLEAAQRLGKPVQAHSRGAEAEVVEILGSFKPKSVLMHWLENEEALPRAQDLGYFVSFGPALLYSKKLQRMAKKAHRGLVLTETDSPVAYGALRRAHGPSLVPSVTFKLAELWRIGFEDARAMVTANAERFLGTPGKINDATKSGLTEVG